MKRMRTVLIYLLLAALVAAAGVWAFIHFNMLGPRNVNIAGTVTRDGKPLEWKTDEGWLSVTFLPKVRDNTTEIYSASTDRKTGRFEIKNIPTGAYKVAVQQHDPDVRHDIFGMVYDPSSTTIEFEVTQDGQEIPIDIPKVLPPRRTPPPSMPPGRPAGPPPERPPATTAGTKKVEPTRPESK